jgi:hypothetical protein
MTVYFLQAFLILNSFIIILTGCSERSKVLNRSEQQIVADIRAINTGRGPTLIATARIPLDDNNQIKYYLLIDGEAIHSPIFSESVLPIRPTLPKVQYGIGWEPVPFHAFDQKINLEAIEATEKGDLKALEKIADSLKGRVSFYFESHKDIDPEN